MAELVHTFKMSLKYDETDDKMTLCASSVDPSEQANVTSTKSCLEWRSRKVDATLTVKSFHFKLYFWVEPIVMITDALVIGIFYNVAEVWIYWLKWHTTM